MVMGDLGVVLFDGEEEVRMVTPSTWVYMVTLCVKGYRTGWNMVCMFECTRMCILWLWGKGRRGLK